MRQWRWGVVLAVAMATTGCAEAVGTAGADGTATPDPQADAPAGPELLADRAAYHGIRPELVLMVDGYRPAPGGGGAYGADGYAAVLVAVLPEGERPDEDTDVVLLAAEPGPIDLATCPAIPVLTPTGAAADGMVECAADGDMFARTAGTWRGYAVQRDAAVVRLDGEDVEAGALRDALDSLRVPTVGELDVILPPPPAPPSPTASDGTTPTPTSTSTPSPGPVERGDLPPGDGAPDNSVGLGG
ncbi:membrane protein [Isoptericola chiayiensis]|uniref:Membrane protein n=1 Tax=Isoptericola chiayiensis TaxID=579446 RepID=A0ABP8YD41_9MICO|nr:hypothetical protein [Isoptericola chiayiensis]NOV99793.1 hypothetical protein [Isoptericola chiayiensis]